MAQDPWAVVSTAPIPKGSDPWAVVSAAPSRPAGLPAGIELPGVQPAPIPSVLRGENRTHNPSNTGLLGTGIGSGVQDSFDANTERLPTYGSTAGARTASAIDNTLRGAVGAAGSLLVHPLETARGIGRLAIDTAPPVAALHAVTGTQSPTQQSAREFISDVTQDPTAALSHAGGGAIGGYAAGEGVLGAARAAAPAIRLLGKGAELASTDLPSARLYGTRILVPGSPGEVLNRALKPAIKYGADTASLFNDAMGPITAEGPISNVADFGKNADAATERNAAAYRAQVAPYESGKGTAPKPGVVNGNTVADAQIKSVPFIKAFEDPSKSAVSGTPSGFWSGPTKAAPYSGIVDRTSQAAAPYRRALDIPTADALREGSNQQLHSYYEKAGGDRYAAEANPEVARTKAVGDTLRGQIYPILDSGSGFTPGTTAANQQMFGKLSDVGDIANKRNTVFSRADPVSLAEKVATGHPGGMFSRALDFAGQRLLRNVTDTDALIRSAVDRFQNPSSPLLPPRPGLFPRAVSSSGRAAQALPVPTGPLIIPPPYRKR